MRKAGDGQRSPPAVARPTESSRTSGADPSIARSQGLRVTGSAGSWAGGPPAKARHTHATMSTTGNSVITATIISARPPERSTKATAPNISATNSRLHAAKTLNLVLLDGSRWKEKTQEEDERHEAYTAKHESLVLGRTHSTSYISWA